MRIPFKIQLLLWYLNRQKAFRIHEMTPVEARNSSGKLSVFAERFLDYPPIPLFRIFDQHISGRNGAIPIRIYQPTDQKGLPVIMFFHGGGFVLRDIDSHDKVCRRISRDNKAVVISVDYRLAPEYKFPSGVYDAYDATVWASKNETVHTGDPSRMVVMGDSAGGNLSIAVSMLSRDRNGPRISCQVLIYPATDGTISSPSVDTFGEGYFLSKKMMQWFIDHYKSKEKDIYNPLMSPLLAEDLSNLPPAFILTAEFDPLKDEGRLFSKRLKEAGNKVKYKDYGGMIHGFISMPKMSGRILNAYKDIQENLSEVFNKKEATEK